MVREGGTEKHHHPKELFENTAAEGLTYKIRDSGYSYYPKHLKKD